FDILESYLARYLPQSLVAVMVPVVLLINIFQLDWISATLLCIAAPLIVFFMILLGKGADSMAKKQWHLLENLSANFLELIEGLL
ncbi:ABC transporter transmembrane domain-containing protein, partial [Alicyclobacillus suci]|uniref:ABC transporter transmembrane domain-containing protein n=1 Tax=Alicyclobacillus suci TaxID=2816080 RepID=UPI0022A7CDCE